MTGSAGMMAIATAVGLSAHSGARNEWVVDCPASELAPRLRRLVEELTLVDLFATTAKGSRPRLTAVLDAPGDPAWLVVHCDLPEAAFPSLSAVSHAASWYERDILEMHKVMPQGHPAPYPLRQGKSGEPGPKRAGGAAGAGDDSGQRPKQRPAVTGQGVFELPLGPVRSGPQESQGFSFFSGGEDIVVTDITLGFKFRSVERIAEGRAPADVILLAERIAASSCFANALAFSRAVERVIGAEVTPSEQFTRTLLAELERAYNHLGVIGRLAEATGLQVAAAQFSLMRERALRASGRLTGHRYLRGALRIGGTEVVPPEGDRVWLRSEVEAWRSQALRLRHLLEGTSTFVDRLDTTAYLDPGYAAEHNLVGPVGRASGIDSDLRRDHPYGAYSAVEFVVPLLSLGDAKARYTVHVMELEQTLGVLLQLLDRWPHAQPPAPLPKLRSGSALGWAEAPGGATVHLVTLDEGGRVARWRARPPAVVNWHPFAHACASGNNLTDFPVIEASFGLASAEFDR